MLKKDFDIDGTVVRLRATSNGNNHMVTVAIRLSDTMPDLASIEVAFPMKSKQSAEAFVHKATEETARRGLNRLNTEYGPFIKAVNDCLSRRLSQAQALSTRDQKHRP